MTTIPKIPVDLYNYVLPEEKIAHFPVSPRDHSKLLLFQNNKISDHHFYNLPEFIPSNSTIVANNTKVIPARLWFSNEKGQKIQIFILKPISIDWTVCEVLVGNRKKFKVEDNLILEDEGLMICNHCSKNIMYLIENEKPSYKEPPKEVTFYAYKKINHFKEILAQFQGKETTQIKNEVIENIKLQIKKERLTLDQLNHYKTKEILKKLGYNKYYEHIAFIKNKLDIKSPIMSNELEDKLCNLLMEIQSPYAKYCPDYRVNFLNYYYVLYKLCELLKEKNYLEYIPMLKDREKLIEQDEIWKKMCSCLNWEFISTI